MKLKNNPVFQRHKIQIQEALETLPPDRASIGKELFSKMLLAATDLDNSSISHSEMISSTQIVILKRDHFHKCCRELGDWMKVNLPELSLTWD